MAGFRLERWNANAAGKTGALDMAWYDGRGVDALPGADDLAAAKHATNHFFRVPDRPGSTTMVVVPDVRDYVLERSIFVNTTSGALLGRAIEAKQGFATLAAYGTRTYTALAAGDQEAVPPTGRGLIRNNATDGGFVPIGMWMNDGFDIVGYYYDPTDGFVKAAQAALATAFSIQS